MMLACLIVLCVPFLVADPPTHALTLSTGEVLRGQLIVQTADRIVFEHPVLGRLVLSSADVTSIVDLTVDPPPDQPAPVDAGPADEPVLKPPPPAPKWKSRVDIGFTGSAGVSQDTNLRASFRTELDTPEIRHRVDGRYLFSTSDGERSDNNGTLGFITDWKIPESHWKYFASARIDYDEFQSWEYRFTSHGGVGYHLFDLKHDDDTTLFDLTLRGGAGLRREFGSIDDQLEPEGLAGFELRWDVTEDQSLRAGSTAFPVLRNFEDFRIVSHLEYTIKLVRLRGVHVSAGLNHEYQSVNDPGVPPNDLKIYLTMGLSF